MKSGLSEATIRLRTLGSVDLRAADGTQIQSVLRQPKRLALLVYLALNGGFQRRDRLLATFWPESNEERARGNLAQHLFQLRSTLGREVIINRGDDEIGLAADRVWCDAAVFDELLRVGRPSEAMELYAGELLPGFIIDDAPEFERWLDEERTSRNGAAANACIELSEHAEKAGDLRLAVQWTRRATVLQPYSEAGYQRLIFLLDLSGDRAAALRAYEELHDLLQTEFGAEPSAETLHLIRAVRTRAEPKGAGSGVAGSLQSPGDPEAFPKRRASRRAILAGSLALIVIAAVVWGVLASDSGEAYRPPPNHVAVLYFNDESPNQDLAYLAEGLTSTLIDQLGQVKQLRVISQNGVRPFRRAAIAVDSIARQLDAGTLVGGSITRSNDRLRVTIQLIDGTTGVVKRSRRLERPNGELFALLDEVSTEVATFLRSALGTEIRLQQWRAETRSVDAWQLSSRAEFLRNAAEDAVNTGDFRSAVQDLQHADSLLGRAARLDRNWAMPLVLRGRIAERRAWMSTIADRPPRSAEWLRLARDFADRALKADDRSHGAYELRGITNFAQALLVADRASDADSLLRAAEQDLATALAIDANLPRAESRLSAVYFLQGRYDEARKAAMRALQADAYLTDADDIVNRLFHTSFEAGDDEEAGYWCDEVRRRMPNRWPAAHCDLILLGWSSVGSPDPRKALHLLEQAGTADSPAMRARMRPQLTMLAAAVLARAGQTDSARVMMQRAHAASPRDPELLYLEATVRVILGELERARDLLEKYYSAKPNPKPGIETRRMFRPLRASSDLAQQP